MDNVKLYLCDPSVYTILIDEDLYKFHFLHNKDEVIVICKVCYYYFTSLLPFTQRTKKMFMRKIFAKDF